MDNPALPFQLGQTMAGTNPDTNALIGERHLGRVFENVPNRNYSTVPTRTGNPILTGNGLTVVALRNVSGGALTGKRAGLRDHGQSGSNTYGFVEQCSGYASGPASGQQVVIDPWLSSGGVADDDIFWGVVKGVVPMTLPATASWTYGDIAVGDLVQATADGKAVRAIGETPIDLERLRVWDAYQTALPGTAANDDLALLSGGITVFPAVQGADFGGTSEDKKARVRVRIPDDYKPGSYIGVRVTGGMITSIADATCTVDFDARVHSGTGAGVSSDLVTTTAKSINNLVMQTHLFAITPTGLVPGDVIDLRMTVAGSDAGNAAVLIPIITRLSLVYGLGSAGLQTGRILGTAVQARDESTHADSTILVNVGATAL